MGLFDKLLGKGKPAAAPPPPPSPASAGGADDWQKESTPQDYAASEVLAKTKEANPPALLDVREAPELARDGFIPGSVHIPMSQMETRWTELDPRRPVVVYCASGIRSFDVGFFLIEKGFADVGNLNGGIHAWKGEVARPGK